ncbi:MAG: prolipoprotein diacylglyceryl transferase [Spirochaetes bacterium]|nr:prolipoprotein diacylglyceryl transferase [Spirochaetota bacterium]
MLIQNINPVMLEIANLPIVGTISLRYYGVLYALGIITAFLICRSFFRKKNYPDEIFEKLIVYVVIGLILGAHFVHLIFYEPASIFNNPIRIIQLGKGLASHGGLLGTLVAVYIFTKKRKLKFWEFLDTITIGGALMVPFIRLGNFFNSEIYGRVTDSPLGVIFKIRGETQPRHPSQLYEMMVGILIFLFLYFFYKKNYKRIKHGTMFYLFLIMYFITRFLLEFVKEYQAVSASFPFTMGQMLSVPLIIIGIYVFIKKKYYKLNPDV